MRFKLYRDAQNDWRWRLVADNGEPIADSAEGYVRKEDAERGIELVREADRAPIEVEP